MMERIETPRLALRKARAQDLDAIWNNVWRDARLAERMLWEPVTDREAAEVRLMRVMEIQREIPAYFACLRDTDEPIGFCGVREVAPGVWEECGICVAAAWQGQGLGGEILRALAALVFGELAGEVFRYSCFSDNLPSARLCQSLGFRFTAGSEAVRQWDGKRYVSYTYTLTRAEWERNGEGEQ